MPNGMFTFRVQVPGQAPFERGIQRFADLIEDWTPFWDDYFREAWLRHLTTQYTTQGRSTGMQWAPLTQAYAAWKQKHWPGLPVGTLSGAVRESLTFRDDPNGIWEPRVDGLTVGSRVPHAWWLQVGTRRMPARPPLRLNDEFVNLMGKLMQEWSVKWMRKAGVGMPH